MSVCLSDAISRLRTGLNSGELSLSVLDAGGGVMLSVQSEQMISLNPSAIAILQDIAAGAEGIDRLAVHLQQQFAVETELAMEDCTRFVLELDAALQKSPLPAPQA